MDCPRWVIWWEICSGGVLFVSCSLSDGGVVQVSSSYRRRSMEGHSWDPSDLDVGLGLIDSFSMWATCYVPRSFDLWFSSSIKSHSQQALSFCAPEHTALRHVTTFLHLSPKRSGSPAKCISYLRPISRAHPYIGSH